MRACVLWVRMRFYNVIPDHIISVPSSPAVALVSLSYADLAPPTWDLKDCSHKNL